MLSSETVLRHIARALKEMRRRARANGGTWTPELESIYLLSVTAGHSGTEFAAIPDHDDARLVLKYEDVARALSVSPKTVQRLAATGALPVVMIGSSPRVTRDDLDAYIASLDRRRYEHKEVI